MTVSDIFNTISESIAKNTEKATSADAVFQFNISGDDGGTWTIDLRQATTADFVREGESGDANVTISMTSEDWKGIVSGSVNPMQAFMMGKIKVDGDMGLAMKLQNVLSLAR